MSYMNLLIRYRADLDDTKDQYTADIKEADDWMEKSLDTTKAKAKEGGSYRRGATPTDQ